jgi:hypothetical protein
MAYSPVKEAAEANKALLEKSQAYTNAKREERAKRQREQEGRELAQQMGGWTESQMGELIEIYKGLA